MKGLFHDLVFGFRQLRKNPSITWAATLCIALGIGANTAVFSFVDALFLRRAPVEDPASLVRIFAEWSGNSPYGALSYPDFLDIRRRADVLLEAVAEAPVPLHLSTSDRRERLWGSVVTANYFSMLGVSPMLGRGFSPEADERDHPVAVLSHGLWQRLFSEREDVLQDEIVLNGQPFTIVGVAPPDFSGMNLGLAPQLWVPIGMVDRIGAGRYELDSRGDQWVAFVIGRLKPGVGLKQAQSSLGALAEHLAAEYPQTNSGKGVRVISEAEGALHPAIREVFVTFLSLLAGVVGLILLLACGNVASLLLSRSASRVQEISIRLALGASRIRLIRQLLCESLLLALMGGLAGLLAGAWLLDLFRSYRIPMDPPVFFEVQLDQRMLLFGLLASLVTGLLFGLTPALRTTCPDLAPALQGRGNTPGRSSSDLRKYLVVGQIALSVVLLVAAGLVLRSLQQAQDIDPGFNPEQLLLASVDLDLQGYAEAQGQQFLEQLKQEIEALPGVRTVGYSQLVPFSFLRNQTTLLPEGYQLSESRDWPSVDLNVVDQGYFQAAGIPILRGRDFDTTDRSGSEPVVIVNETFGQRFWPNRDPLGARVQVGGKEHRVVGIAANGKYHSLGEKPIPYLYQCLKQNYAGMVTLHVRTSTDPLALSGPVRETVGRLDETLPVASLQTMQAQLGIALLPARLAAWGVSAFAALALLLASVGLYGLISHLVSLRRQEIGIRKTLGASPREVFRLVLVRGLKLLILGAILGIIAGAALTPLMGGVLYGVSATNPTAYLIALLPLIVTALIATLVPAWRALRIDPATALRSQ